jgi:hypothetical protein
MNTEDRNFENFQVTTNVKLRMCKAFNITETNYVQMEKQPTNKMPRMSKNLLDFTDSNIPLAHAEDFETRNNNTKYLRHRKQSASIILIPILSHMNTASMFKIFSMNLSRRPLYSMEYKCDICVCVCICVYIYMCVSIYIHVCVCVCVSFSLCTTQAKNVPHPAKINAKYKKICNKTGNVSIK